MQILHDAAPIATGSEPDQPSHLVERLRRGGRIVGRLVACAVIAAAGVGGWLAVERFVFPALAGTIVAAANEGPWPDEFAQPSTRWDSFTLSSTQDGVETHRSSFDPVSRRTAIVDSGADGAVIREVELAGVLGFERTPESPEWSPVDDARIDAHILLGVAGTEPVHLSALVPDEADDFTTVIELDAAEDTRRFLVVVDTEAFRVADPIAFHRWSEFQLFGSELDTDLRWTVDVRPDGFVVRWEGRSSSVETWSERPGRLEFESPLAADESTATAEPATPNTLTPPTTAAG